MMKPIGKSPLWAGLLLMFFCAISRAEVTASVDRDRVSLGDTLSFTISATQDDEDLSNLELQPLLRDFEVLQRSTTSNTSIINFKRSHSRKLIMEIAPRRAGALVIPPLQVGAKNTPAIAIQVAEAVPVAPSDATVLFEAEVDRSEVFVQGQILLTLRLQQAVNLVDRSISDLELDNAFVVPLEQKSFQRTVANRNWLVHEVRYAIFPEKSGTLEIPPQSFSAREGQARRSFTRGGKVVRRQSQPLSISVQAKPASYPTSTWLPARQLALEESWSKSPQRLQAGESVTRTIVVRGEGLQGAQLPPLATPTIEGVKFYPDQPSIDDSEIGTGLLGSRKDSLAIVPTQAGSLTLPEVRIPWWDTQAKALRYAVLPSRDIQVSPAPADGVIQPAQKPIREKKNAATLAPPNEGTDYWPWHLVALLSTAGWVATIVYIVARRRNSPALNPTTPAAENISERKAYKRLLAACAAESAFDVRAALLDWANTLSPAAPLTSLRQVGDWFADNALSEEIQRLDTILFAEQKTMQWRSSDLTAIIKRLRHEQSSKKPAEKATLTLYRQST